MAWDSVEQLASFFEKVRPIYLLYRGATKGTAYCARLVLEEVARFPGIAMEAGDFRQGPMEVIDGEFGAMIFSSTAEQMALNIDLANSIQSSGGRVMALTPAAEQTSTQQAWFYPTPRGRCGFAPGDRTGPRSGAGMQAGGTQRHHPRHGALHQPHHHHRSWHPTRKSMSDRPFDIITIGDLCVDLAVDLGEVMPVFGQVERMDPELCPGDGGLRQVSLPARRQSWG